MLPLFLCQTMFMIIFVAYAIRYLLHSYAIRYCAPFPSMLHCCKCLILFEVQLYEIKLRESIFVPNKTDKVTYLGNHSLNVKSFILPLAQNVKYTKAWENVNIDHGAILEQITDTAISIFCL